MPFDYHYFNKYPNTGRDYRHSGRDLTKSVLISIPSILEEIPMGIRCWTVIDVHQDWNFVARLLIAEHICARVSAPLCSFPKYYMVPITPWFMLFTIYDAPGPHSSHKDFHDTWDECLMDFWVIIYKKWCSIGQNTRSFNLNLVFSIM